MAVTLTSQPAKKLNSGYNCLQYCTESNSAITNEGEFANVTIRIDNVASAGENFNLYGITFTGAASPDASGKQFKVSSLGSYDQAKLIGEALNANATIAKDFDVDVTDDKVNVKALNRGAKYTLNPNITNLPNATIILNDVGEDFVLEDRYNLYLLVMLKSGSEFIPKDELSKPGEIDSTFIPSKVKACFRIDDLLRSHVKSVRPDYHQSTISLKPEMIAEFLTKFGEKFGDPIERKLATETASIFILNAVWQYEQKGTELVPFSFIDGTVNPKFLTNITGKKLCLGEYDYLYLVVFDKSSAGGIIEQYIDVEYDTGEILTYLVDDLVYTGNGVAILPSGPANFNLTAFEIGKNLFTDGDAGTFEQNITGISSTETIVQSSTEAYEGTKSVKFSKTVGNDTTSSTVAKGDTAISFKKNLRYILKARVFVASGPTQTANPQIYLKGPAGYNVIKPWRGNTLVGLTSGVDVFDDWVEIITEFIPSADVSSTVELFEDFLNTGTNVYVDKVEVFHAGSECYKNLFIDGDDGTFESGTTNIFSDGTISNPSMYSPEGAKVLQIATVATDPQIAFRGETLISVKAGKSYKISCWVRPHSATDGQIRLKATNTVGGELVVDSFWQISDGVGKWFYIKSTLTPLTDKTVKAYAEITNITTASQDYRFDIVRVETCPGDTGNVKCYEVRAKVIGNVDVIVGDNVFPDGNKGTMEDTFLIANAFETESDELSPLSPTGTQFHSGAKSLKVIWKDDTAGPTPEEDILLRGKTTITFKANGKYEARAWVRVASPILGTGNSKLRLEVVESVSVTNTYIQKWDKTIDGADVWTELITEFSFSGSFDLSARLIIRIESPAGLGSGNPPSTNNIYVDDIVIKEMVTAETYDSEAKKFCIDDRELCCGAESFLFLNELGAYETIKTQGISRKEIPVVKTEIERVLDCDYDLGDRGRTVTDVDADEEFFATTPFVAKDEFQKYLEFVKSIDHYLDRDGAYLPVILTGNSFRVFEKRDTFALQFKFVFAFDRKSQTQ